MALGNLAKGRNTITPDTILWEIILRKLKLSESQKLIVFLGGINAVDRKLEEIESSLEEEDSMRAVEIVKEKTNELRVQIVDMLNRSGEVKDILDLFKDPPPIIDFNPIMFGLHLPISLQKAGYRLTPDHAEVEDFVVVYDGQWVMVATVCALDKRPWGVYDVRDKLTKMMNTIISNLETTPPCLTHQAIAFVNKPDEISKDLYPRDIYLKFEPKWGPIEAFQNLYIRLTPEIESFYSACETAKETDEVAWKIDENETNLLSSLKEFLTTTWWHPLKRTKILRQMKTFTIEILENLSKHSSLVRQLKENRSEIEEYRAHNDLFSKLMETVKPDEYAKSEAVDSESLIRIIEHVRSETETYSSFISTLISALIGAIIGSALTIIVSYLLGLLQSQ